MVQHENLESPVHSQNPFHWSPRCCLSSCLNICIFTVCAISSIFSENSTLRQHLKKIFYFEKFQGHVLGWGVLIRSVSVVKSADAAAFLNVSWALGDTEAQETQAQYIPRWHGFSRTCAHSLKEFAWLRCSVRTPCSYSDSLFEGTLGVLVVLGSDLWLRPACSWHFESLFQALEESIKVSQ